jgi:hypothetical protein
MCVVVEKLMRNCFFRSEQNIQKVWSQATKNECFVPNFHLRNDHTFQLTTNWNDALQYWKWTNQKSIYNKAKNSAKKLRTLGVGPPQGAQHLRGGVIFLRGVPFHSNHCEQNNFLGEFEPWFAKPFFRYPQKWRKRQNPVARRLTYGRHPSTLQGVMIIRNIARSPSHFI